MSTLAERAGAEMVCPGCGARLATDQEWCLECGTPVRVAIRRAPDWRAPLAIVAGVVVLVAVGFVIALVALSNTANRSVGAPSAAASSAAASPAAASTTAASTKPAAHGQTPAGATTTSITTVAAWPAGVTGYTVVLGVDPSKASASASATKIAGAGTPAGVLFSSDYSSMHPGDWIVFSGTYTTLAQATAAANQIKAKGQPGAYAFSVVPAH